ncbi:MAG: hypothetical protein ACRD2G_00290 [Terriglobia bacterium]
MRLERTAARVVFSLTLAGFIPAVLAGAQAQSTPSPDSMALGHSVVVIGPHSPMFDTLLERWFPGAGGVRCFATVKPLLAIVHNNTRRVVKAYVVKWVITNSDGTTTTKYLNGVNEPSNVWQLTGQVNAMGPGGSGTATQLVSPFFRWTEERFPNLLAGQAVIATFCALAQQLPVVQQPLVFEAQTASSIRLSLDGIIFGDGVFVGPDTSKLFERFEAAQKAEVDEGAWLLSQINGRSTDQEIRNGLSQHIYAGHNDTGTDRASLYGASRGEEAGRLLGALNELSPAGLAEVARRLAGERPLTLTRRVSP